MLLSILGIAVIAGVSYLAWLLWINREYYIGADNRHKFFAEYFKDFPVFHNGKTMPMKKKLFDNLHTLESNIPEVRKRKGIRLLEIGAGTGANFEFYPPNTSLVVVDPNPYFKQYLDVNLKKFPNVKLEQCVVAGAEDMKDVPDNSVDVVVSTLVLCSVPDLMAVYKEIRRVLVPGGKFLFMEHVIDDTSLIIRFLQILGSKIGLFQLLFDGCRPDKDMEPVIKKAGFASVDMKRFRLDLKEGVPKGFWGVYMIEPHLWGVATTA